ncbi:MAG: cytochrome c, partial [Longimicrobiales bacterium]|nr:cytochrome c [Longimicrobiales bacterium]
EAEEEEATEVVASGAFSAQSAYQGVCATCHGSAGDGNGPAGAALDPPPANFTDAAFWADRDKERIMTVIDQGAAAVGGSSLMAPFGGLYTDEQISELADYVISFAPEGAAPSGE